MRDHIYTYIDTKIKDQSYKFSLKLSVLARESPDGGKCI